MFPSFGLAGSAFCYVVGSIAVLCFLCGCGRNDKVEHIVQTEKDLLTVKHEWRIASEAGWKGEVWVDGSQAPVWYPLDVWLRFTPEDKGIKELPKIEVRLRLRAEKAREAIREGSVVPEFQECSTMKKRHEITYDHRTRGWGPRTSFPPEGPCWETRIKDPFKSDRRSSGTTPLDPGEYLLDVEATLVDGPQFKFEPIRQKLYVGGDRPGGNR